MMFNKNSSTQLMSNEQVHKCVNFSKQEHAQIMFRLSVGKVTIFCIFEGQLTFLNNI